MNSAVKELALICFVSVLSLLVAWEYEANYFAMFFAAAAVLSLMEAISRSL